MIDLRSDTVTQPTDEMRHAMANAPVGDDVYNDDPSIIAFQSTLAERAGKEAALFFPSGTQSNLAALMAHCQRGDEYIVGQEAHTYKFEGGGAAVLGSIQPQPIEHAADGSLPVEKIQSAIKKPDFHFARTKLIALENTWHGKVLPASYIEKVAELARSNKLGLHLDGARIMNAAVASGKGLADMVKPFDSVSICFSKGLGAPVGSALVGSKALIEEARRWRKMLGGGLRQSGILAAACLHALEHHVERLADDHRRAEDLAREFREIDEIQVIYQATNMVLIKLDDRDAEPLSAYLNERGIILKGTYGGPTRIVTHLGIDDADIALIVKSFKDYFHESTSR